MNKEKENVILLRAVTSLGESIKSCIYISPLFYNAQCKQIMDLIAGNYGRSWRGVALYIGASDYGHGAVWTFGSLSNYLITQDDLNNIKACVYQEEFFNGFC